MIFMKVGGGKNTYSCMRLAGKWDFSQVVLCLGAGSVDLGALHQLESRMFAV